MSIYVPQNLDMRRLILGFPAEDFIITVAPIVVGFVFGSPLVGLAASTIGLGLLKSIKRALSAKNMHALFYRYLPNYDNRLPPSHWRRVGG